MRAELELDFLMEDIHALMSESKEGILRVRKIVQDLKDFSRIDASQEWQWSNLHDGIDSTLNIVNNEIKYKADLIKEYGAIPDIECLPSQINQVILNLVVNAAHAIQNGRGKIIIRTGSDSERIWFEVIDSGSGIAKENMTRIFDPFFTTKPVGQGTGLGLSLSYGIIQKHRGEIQVNSDVGKGSTFKVVLPIRQIAP
jgi:signal transduction histidine kinase